LGYLVAAAMGLGLVFGDAAAGSAVAIIHAQAWTMMDASGGRIDDATIVIRDGRYESVARGAPPPSDARVIDAAGHLVTPGLMDAETQLGLVEVSSLAETRDHGVNHGPLGAAFDVQYGLNANSMLLPVALGDGLTRAVSSPTATADPVFLGMGAVLRIQPGGDILDRPKAAMYAWVGGLGIRHEGGSRSAQWQLLRNALDEAKTYNPSRAVPVPRDQLQNAINIAALRAMLDAHTPLAIRASRESDIRQAVALARDYRLRLIVVGGSEAWRCAGLLAANKVAVVLDPDADIPWTFNDLGSRGDNAALLAKAGVTIAFSMSGNTIQLSHNAGSAVREGAGLAVASGLSYAEALRALTVNPATIFDIADHYGSMARGQDADLVVWDGDPLEPSTAADVVFVRGVQAGRVTHQSLLRDRYAPSHAQDRWPAAYRP
jgi:imidazolonepropionase-like amidohydrolase